MKEMIYKGIIVSYSQEISEPEALQYVEQDIEAFAIKRKKLAKVDIKLINDEIEIKSIEKSPIKRLRRITGYLSNVDNFNDAKQAEYKDRINHM